MNLHHTQHHFARHAFAVILSLFLAVLAIPLAARADTLDVTAKVDAPLPTSPAIIISPVDQQRFTASPITVTGTCGDGVYVVLYKNGVVAGTGACTGSNFSIQITLTLGANVLQAKVYNSTDNEGPSSPTITVYLDTIQPEPSVPPVFAIPPGDLQQNNTPLLQGQFFILYSPEKYRTYKTDEIWKGEISVHGGTKPYSITVDWGDETLLHYNQATSDPFDITHAFKKPGIYQPIIHAKDAAGLTTSLQLFVVVTKPAVYDLTEPHESSIIPAVVIATVGIIVVATLIIQIASLIGSSLAPKSPTPKE